MRCLVWHWFEITHWYEIIYVLNKCVNIKVFKSLSNLPLQKARLARVVFLVPLVAPEHNDPWETQPEEPLESRLTFFSCRRCHHVKGLSVSWFFFNEEKHFKYPSIPRRGWAEKRRTGQPVAHSWPSSSHIFYFKKDGSTIWVCHPLLCREKLVVM